MPTYPQNLSMQLPQPNPANYFNQQPSGGPGSGGGWYQGYSNMGGPQGGGGGNPFAMAGTGAGTGMMIGGPVGAAIGGGLGLLGGIFGGLASGKKEKEKKKAFQKAQAAYQSKASQLFPELGKESFQYQNPQLNDAIQSALMYRMGNMFSGWGVPEGMRGGAESLNQFFSQAWPGQQKQPQSGTAPSSRQLPRNARPGGGGWREDFKRSRPSMR